MADDKCDQVTFYSPSARIGGVVRPPSCVPDLKKQGQELREPTGAPESAPQLQTPRAIGLSNRIQIARCSDRNDGSEGYDITVADGTLMASVPFSTTLAASPSALDFIAKNNIVDKIEEEQRSGVLTEKRLEELTLLPPSLVSILYASIQTSQDRLNSSAKTLADSQLSCEWFNEAQTATCTDPEMAHSYEVEGAVFTVTVPARTISSLVSQEEADRIAYAQALSTLNCFYVSDPYTVTCLTRPDIPEGVTEPVPDDTEPVYPGLLPRKGAVSLEKGAYTSAYSKEAANQQAETAALSMLNCYYVNDPVFLQCSDPNARAHGVDPTKYPAVDANPVTNTQGQRVSIPKGFVTSVLSTEDANSQAQLLAESLLTCCFMSPEMTVACKPVPQVDIYGNPVYDEEGNQKYVPADEKTSPVYKYTLPAGMFTSCTSQEEVNAQAEDYIAGVLQCYYCNTLVLPTCVPDWVVSAASSGVLLTISFTTPSGKTYNAGDVYKIDLPLNPKDLVNPYTGVVEDTTAWSQDATVGTSAGIVCGFDYQQMQQVAESLAGGLVTVARTDDFYSCYYGNDLLIAGCKFHDPYKKLTNPSTARFDTFLSQENKEYRYGSSTMGSPSYTTLTDAEKKYEFQFVNGDSILEIGTLPDGTPYRVYRKDVGNISLAASNPPVDSYIVFPANFVSESANSLKAQGYLVEGYTEESIRHYVKEQVNAIVQTMADSMLQCVYGNPPCKIACDMKSANPVNVWSWYQRQIQTAKKRITYGGNDTRYTTRETSTVRYKHPYWNIGAGKSSQNLAPWSPSSRKPVVIPSDMFIDTNYQRVYEKTRAFATSLLVCMYGNTQVTCAGGGAGTCVDIGGGQEEGTYLLNESVGGGNNSSTSIAAMTVYSTSQTKATDLAKSLCSSSAAVPCLYTNYEFACECYNTWNTLPQNITYWEDAELSQTLAQKIDDGTFVSTVSKEVLDQCLIACNLRCTSNMSWIMTNAQKTCRCTGLYPEVKKQTWVICADSFLEIKCEDILSFDIPPHLFMGNAKTADKMLDSYCMMMCRLAETLNPCIPGRFQSGGGGYM